MHDASPDGLPVIAGTKPSYHELKKGRKYFWCACGLQKSSHSVTARIAVPG